jgi:hypothetical protein
MVGQLLPNTNENATVYFGTPKFESKHSLCIHPNLVMTRDACQPVPRTSDF